MPTMLSSVMSRTRIITVLSLFALCSLSFGLIFGTDTLARDTIARNALFSLPKNITVSHQARALHHARASASTADSVPTSAPAPSQPAFSAAAVNSQASSPPAVSSPSPSPSSPPPAQQSFSTSPSPSPATSASPAATSAPATSSPTPTSSPSPSPSLSSNTPAVSSRLVTSSSVGVGVVSTAASPITSFINTANTFTSGLGGFSPTTTGSTLTINASSSAGAASSGFFKNKAAVGVTFSIVGIVGGLAVIMGVLTFLRRHRRTREAIEDEEFFEKFPSGDGDFGDVPHTPSGFGTASVTEISTSAASPDAYPDRAIHYGQSNPSTVLNPVDYGIAYPPSASAGGGGKTYDVRQSQSLPSSSHPFANPNNVTTAAPPVSFPRHTPGRAHEMVTTDSYYGPNTAGVGAGAGYAQ